MRTIGWAALTATVLIACGGPSETDDAAVAADADPTVDAGPTTVVCERDLDCTNEDFCDGVERCRPGDAAANPATGCVAGEPACEAGGICDEEGDRCEACTPENRDMDGDFAISNACGGPDCDDTNPSIHPDAEEICDAAGVDEDCDEDTFGRAGPSGVAGDADGDSFVSAMCCQVTRTGFQCGDDCDDDNREVNPDASEICNGVDDDCDGALDPVLEDRDADGWAGCADLPDGMRDCDETNPLTYPGAAERCDGEDNDCDGSAAGEDLDRDDHLGVDVVCEAGPLADLPRTDCDDDDDTIAPTATELCDAVDHDCDGSVDESPAVASCPDDGVTTYACNAGACEVASCASTHDDCNVDHADGCEQPLSVRDHCGACGTQCQWTCGAGPTCDDPVAVSAGGLHVCARTVGSRVRCWGRNHEGQLGIGSTDSTPATRPGDYVSVTVAGSGVFRLETVQEVESGALFTCARDSSGRVWCWGANDHGQLGDGVAGPARPLGVTHVSNATDIAVGETHACAIIGGTVRCWGDNSRGQVGGTVSAARSPFTVFSAEPVAQIAVGLHHSCLLTDDGDVYCWGDDTSGQLGDGTPSAGAVTVPQRVVGASGTGYLTGYDRIQATPAFTCASGGVPSVVCWGSFSATPMAMGPPSGASGTAVSLREVSDTSQHAVHIGGFPVAYWMLSTAYIDITSDVSWPGVFDAGVSLGSYADPAETNGTACLLDRTGLRCFSANAYGQAGNGTRSPVSEFTRVLSPP